MSSRTYTTLRRELIQKAQRLNKAIRSRNQELVDTLTEQVRALVARLSKVMSHLELNRILAAAGLVLALGTSPTQLHAQSFAPPVVNPFGLIDVLQGAWIEFADLDGDGDLDGIAGGYSGYYSSVIYFENVGNANQASFAAQQVNPFDIEVMTDGFLLPAAVDIDQDGDLDLMLSFEYGILFLENTGSATDPSFASPQVNPFGITPTEYMFSPTFADLDGDGDLDLMVGSYYYDDYTYNAPVIYLENTGSATVPEFAQPVLNPFGLTGGYYFSFPTLVDLDADGDLDMLLGDRYEYYSGSYDSKLLYFENIGDEANPEFAEPQENPFGLSGGYYISYPSFADMDNDGDQDLFIGEVSADDDYFGRFVYYENLGSSNVTPIADSDRIRIYPNPASGIVYLTSDISIRSIEVIDVLGRKVNYASSVSQLDINKLSAGLATLRVTDIEGRVFVNRFIIVHE